MRKIAAPEIQCVPGTLLMTPTNLPPEGDLTLPPLPTRIKDRWNVHLALWPRVRVLIHTARQVIKFMM